jgi:hypothetical protein
MRTQTIAKMKQKQIFQLKMGESSKYTVFKSVQQIY